MKSFFRFFLPAALTAALLPGCASLPFGQASLVDTDWTLQSLADHAGSTGAGGKAPTLHLDGGSQRAYGFAGCNRFMAGYEVAGNSIRFTSPAATMMACADGMALEQSYLASLALVTSYTLEGRTLTLKVADKPVAVLQAK